MLGLGSRQRNDYTLLYSLVELVRFKKLHSVAQFPSPGTVEESSIQLNPNPKGAKRGAEASDLTCPVSAASSTGQCNTIQCVDSTILPREKRSVWL
jgi:hypothetical protein